MKRKPSYVRNFSVQPYNWTVFVFDDKEKLLRFILRRMIGSAKVMREDLDESRGITYVNDHRSEVYIGVFDGEGPTLVHEIVHAAFSILGYSAVKVQPQECEALAYLVEHISRECSK